MKEISLKHGIRGLIWLGMLIGVYSETGIWTTVFAVCVILTAELNCMTLEVTGRQMRKTANILDILTAREERRGADGD